MTCFIGRSFGNDFRNKSARSHQNPTRKIERQDKKGTRSKQAVKQLTLSITNAPSLIKRGASETEESNSTGLHGDFVPCDSQLPGKVCNIAQTRRERQTMFLSSVIKNSGYHKSCKSEKLK
ncbi:hypothetical protein POX_f07518 [Penicillium oxalicum]|uniref:Uncharacterized protein n=1 Tax=Penicillium oxalicum (strain 114-2 / CGMCC 5302) TaxID=933388 RepID=S7ZDT2_PENO1|nr:hypothetical protein POX_f07518 [Penicillium oxalicum]EPS28434.1 hypothetical protein PDE_03380 [Penicillium oxalicum 114-2]KAI2787155.1 hypothetical protein POX_f07518 [Penicillium oxalicum]